MEFSRTVRVHASLDEVWALTNEIDAVALCIPGLSDLQMQGPRVFDCLLAQQVGAVKANFRLRNEIKDVVPQESLTVVSEGKDKALNSSVKATQVFDLSDAGQETEVQIAANIHVTGRIATFGRSIILARAEKVTVEALDNVSALLQERRSAGA